MCSCISFVYVYYDVYIREYFNKHTFNIDVYWTCGILIASTNELFRIHVRYNTNSNYWIERLFYETSLIKDMRLIYFWFRNMCWKYFYPIIIKTNFKVLSLQYHRWRQSVPGTNGIRNVELLHLVLPEKLAQVNSRTRN